MGYLTSVPMLRVFLSQARAGKPHPGVSSLSISTQTLESPCMRKFMGIPEDIVGGVRVRTVSAFGASSRVRLCARARARASCSDGIVTKPRWPS